MMMIPVILLSFAPMIDCITFINGSGMKLDYLAFLKYDLGWLLPTVLIVTAVGYFVTEFTESALAVLIQGIWWFVSLQLGVRGMSGGMYGFNLIPRHNTEFNYTGFAEGFQQLLLNRMIYVGMALVLMAATVWIYDKKRKGHLRKNGKNCGLVKEQIRHNIGWQTGLSVLLLAGSPLIWGIRNLDLAQSAKVLEMYVATIGILLFVPVFQPEQNKDLRDLITSKYTDIRCIYGVRVGLSVLVGGILLFVYMGVMRHGNCEMELGKFFFGTMAEMLAFGGIGILAYAWSDNLIVGYMVPIVYYVIAYGGEQNI